MVKEGEILAKNKGLFNKRFFALIGCYLLIMFVFAISVPAIGLQSPIDSSEEIFLLPSKEHILGKRILVKISLLGLFTD